MLLVVLVKVVMLWMLLVVVVVVVMMMMVGVGVLAAAWWLRWRLIGGRLRVVAKYESLVRDWLEIGRRLHRDRLGCGSCI